jgi:hypothetical protein
LVPPTSSIETSVNAIGASTSATLSSIDTSDYATLEDRLESFMDKLSVWQMMATINLTTADATSSQLTTQRDWMQDFCENVVSPL